MPLPPPAVSRRHLHTRHVEVRGYEREDGLFDIEARLVDTKTYSFPNRDRGGEIQAGEPLHGMWLRLTLDLDLVVHDAVAATDHAPYAVCPEAASRYHKLVGARIGPGWRRRIKSLFGGTDGCTHLTELLGPLATTAYQTVYARRQARSIDTDARPVLLDTCHGWASDGPVVRREFPRFYTGEDAPAPTGPRSGDG